METNKTGIIYDAMKIETRNSFVNYRRNKDTYKQNEFNEMEAYILSDECVEDLEDWANGKFNMTPPLHYVVPKNLSGRKRHVYSWKGKTIYLLKLLSFTMRKHDNMYPDGLYSFRTKVTAQDFLLKLRDFKGIENYYIVKTDVSNYVGSIVPEQIIPMLEELWKDDPTFVELLKYLLLRREVTEKDGTVVKAEPGGLGGIPLANHFMNVYLMELDRYFGPRSVLYCRYSDDIIIFAKTKEEAEGYLEYLYSVLKKRQLSTNSDKTCLIEPGEEVEILGCKMVNGKMDISDHAKGKIKRKIRMRANKMIKWKTQLKN